MISGNKTSDGIASTDIQADALAVNAGKLQRADDGTFEVARFCQGEVTAVANGPATKCTVTAPGHKQKDGATVTLALTGADYDGAFVISNVTVNTFDIIATFTATATGVFTSDNEYVSPNQHGGAFGTVYRKYYRGLSAVGELHSVQVHASLTGHIDSGGYVSTAAMAQYPYPWGDAFAADLAKTESKAFTIGSSWAGPFRLWVDYTRS